MSRYKLYLKDIMRAISSIENSVKNKSVAEFEKDKELVDASAMRLQIIGESISKLPGKFKTNKKIRWDDLKELRNIISHAYFRINPKILYDVIKTQVPGLKNEVGRLLKEEED